MNTELNIPKNLPSKYLDTYIKIGNILLSDKNILGAVLSGSFFDNKHGPTSDLDIITISKKDIRQRRQLSIGGVFVELFIYSKEELYRSFKEGDYQDMNMMGYGFIMFDKINTLNPIRRIARRFFEKGPKKLNKGQEIYLKYLIWDSYCNVVDILELDRLGASALMNRNIWQAIEIYYKLKAIWFCRPKRMLSEIERIDKNLHAKLMKFYSSSTEDINLMFTEYASVVESIMAPNKLDKHFVWQSKPRKGKLII